MCSLSVQLSWDRVFLIKPFTGGGMPADLGIRYQQTRIAAELCGVLASKESAPRTGYRRPLVRKFSAHRARPGTGVCVATVWPSASG